MNDTIPAEAPQASPLAGTETTPPVSVPASLAEAPAIPAPTETPVPAPAAATMVAQLNVDQFKAKAEKELADRIAAKAKVFQDLKGKTFRAKLPNPRLPDQYFVVTDYIGVLGHMDGLKWHTIEVESRNPSDIRYTPAGAKFLETHEPFTPPVIDTSNLEPN
jgi:hypothetical protein